MNHRNSFTVIGILFVIVFLSNTASGELVDKRTYKPNIILRSEWGARPLSTEYIMHIPDKLTIHHTAGKYSLNQDNAKIMQTIQKFHMDGKGWEDIAYHYLIAPDGSIYEGRPVLAVGDTATNYDPTNHLLVCLMGNFEIQEPTREQLDTLVSFTAWLLLKYNISPDTISGHKDYAATLCPGKSLYKIIKSDEFKNEVKAFMKKIELQYY